VRRREFITLAGSAAAWPLAARAQQPAMPVIGFLNSSSADAAANRVNAFRKGLRESGYVEGRDVGIELRSADGLYERLPTLAADLVRRGVAVIVAGGGPAARAAKAATATIPIVFNVGVDPVTIGLVASIGRPGGNATGTSVINRELDAKRLEILRELLPTASMVAVLLNPNNPSAEILSGDIKTAANGLGQQILVLNVGTDHDLDTAIVHLLQRHADGLVVTDDPLFIVQGVKLVELAARHKIPTIYAWRENVDAGGLISHGASITYAYRQVGIYAGRILRGAKPSDLPVLEPTKFETVLNLRTAKALGLDVPTSILLRADEVIE